MKNIIPNLSVDCVVFGFDHNTLRVLLTKRELKDPKTNEVYFVDYTLQGHHVLENEDLNKAAARVLKDKTGLEGIYLEQFQTFGGIGRMDREKDKLWIKKTGLNIADHVVRFLFCPIIRYLKTNIDIAKTAVAFRNKSPRLLKNKE